MIHLPLQFIVLTIKLFHVHWSDKGIIKYVFYSPCSQNFIKITWTANTC
ncbi:hypothetical protein GLYMA_12G045951v4 [Glycine max]|nr:hypothetical protein GLYMA_12G045951v4 [Glycine max]KAH1141595.1 hypothetical protein GYH30_032703 [Glycine max]